AYELVNITRHPRYIHGKPFAMVFTSRGCPYRCAFCYRGPSGGKRLRFMSVDRVMEEVSYLHSRFGFEAFDFHDDLFTINRERVLEICHAFLNRGVRFSWICEARVNQVDFELLKVMKRAGCVGIYFGVESGHPYILEKMNKGITPAQIERTFSLCRRARIPTVAYFILGTPWDTEESFKTTLQIVKEIKPTVSVFFAARPFPRTALREAFVQHGMAIPQTYDDYAYFVEGEDNAGTRGETNRYQQQEVMIRQRCIHATRRALFYQLKDILSYPRLIAELIDLYGFRQFVVLARRRLGIFIKSA
ncbi:MAG: radical SAM protein, partial [Proteobacteria bacterium]|nr:radical SAM protein [Pseudomonadota bacterium]